MSAGRTDAGLGVRADVSVLRAHYGREDLLPGRGVRLPARGGAGGQRQAAVGSGRAGSAPHCWPPSRSAFPRRYWPDNAPGQMDILGWLSAPERECGEVNQFRLLAVEALWQTYIRTLL